VGSQPPSTDRAAVQRAVAELIRCLGLDPVADPELAQTPARVADFYAEIFSGLELSAEPELVCFPHAAGKGEVVLVRDVAFHSLCVHHFVPFFGRAHVAYLPDRSVVGVSGPARLVEYYARRPQIQERMTNQIAQTILEKINPLGVAVVCEGTHLCMSMRGVEKQNSFAVTSAMLGIFRDNARTRMEFLELLKLRSDLPTTVSAVNGLTCVGD